MFIALALKLSAISPGFKRLLWRSWYQYLARYDLPEWRFMNYGYASSDAQEARPALDAEDEADRYAIQLYHRVANAVPLSGRDVLEVGCGRGGGSSFVKRYHRPRRM